MSLPSGLKNEESELDLDELEEDSEDDPNVFRIREPLATPVHVDRTIRDLHVLIHEGGVDLSPPYQRDVVWPESKQIALIESIFRRVPIPSIIFAVKPSEDNVEELEMVCVDGKQRLTSIQKFCDGQIPYKDPVTKKLWWYTLPESSKATRLEIPEKHKKEFAETYIRCVECHGLTPTAERDIFQRVQMGMTLTGAEKMQAISSPWADWISRLEARHVAVDGGLSSVLEWDTKRGRDFQNIAYLVYFCDGLPDSERLPAPQKMMTWLSRLDNPPAKFAEDIDEVLIRFWHIASDESLNTSLKTMSSRLAPVEFIFIGVLLFSISTKCIEEQANCIKILRQTIRANHKDIRLNSTVTKDLWATIRGIQNNSIKVAPNKPGTKKRRKAPESDDEEYRPSPIASLGKSVSTRPRHRTILS